MAGKVNTTESIKVSAMTEGEMKAQEKKLADIFKDAPKKTLFIPEGLGIQNPLPVGINGVQIAIPIGVEVEVPEPFYNIVMKQSDVLNRRYGKTLVDGKPLEDLVKVKEEKQG